MKEFSYRQTLIGCTIRYANLFFIAFFASALPMPAHKAPIVLISSVALAINGVVHLTVLVTKRHREAAYLMYLVDILTIGAAIYFSGMLASPFTVTLPLTFYSIYYAGFSKRAAVTLGVLAILYMTGLFALWAVRGDGPWAFRAYPEFALAAFAIQAGALLGFVYLAIAPDPFVAELNRQERLLAQQQQHVELGASLGVIVHELRTPLTVLSGRLEMLADRARELAGADGDAGERYAGLARDEVQRINGMLESVADYARERRGRYRMEPHAVAEIAGRASDFFALKYGRHRTHLQARLALPADATVTCDRDAVFQVLVNLLNNAVQAKDPSRRLELSLTAVADGADVLFSVTDNGKGIPPELQGAVFERSFTQREGGSGIGLFVSRQIVEDHGGALALTSTPGVGTSVTVRLPKAGRPGGSEPATPAAGRNGTAAPPPVPAVPPAASPAPPRAEGRGRGAAKG